jgi:E3 ubiquitin-protein ligase HUWE1
MLGKAVDHKDLESIDPEYYKSLVWMLSNDIDGVLDLTFSVERDDFGVTKIVDLVPDGRNIAVTNENKAEYIRLVADQRLSTEIKDQIAVCFPSQFLFTIAGNHTESFILVLGPTRWFVRNRS